MTSGTLTPPETSDPAPAKAPRRGGKFTVLGLLVAAPALIVALLLTGYVDERQICLNTLDQQEAEFWMMGGTRLTQPDWQRVDEWPEGSGRFREVGYHPEPLRDKPSSFTAEVWEEAREGAQWAVTKRTLPFAFFVGVPNSRALRQDLMNIVDVHLVMAGVLDPAEEADREVLRRIVERMSEGMEEVGALRGRALRNRDATPGEVFAAGLMDSIFEALEQPDQTAALREMFYEAAERD